jgi:hypothetical protein
MATLHGDSALTNQLLDQIENEINRVYCQTSTRSEMSISELRSNLLTAPGRVKNVVSYNPD